MTSSQPGEPGPADPASAATAGPACPVWQFPLPWPAVLRRRATLAWVAAVGSTLFVLLAVIVHSGWHSSYRIDARVAVRASEATQDHETYEEVVSTVTHLGDSVVVAAIAGLVLLGLLLTRHWWSAAFVVAAVGGGMVVTTAMKYVVERPRPPSEYGLAEDSPSFPSGHTAGTTLLWLTLLVLILPWEPTTRRRIITAVAVGMPLVVGASRVLLAAHFVTDVLASLVLGVTVVALSLLLVRPWRDIDDERRWYGLDPPVEPGPGQRPVAGQRLGPGHKP